MNGLDSAPRFSAAAARAAGYEIGARYINQSSGRVDPQPAGRSRDGGVVTDTGGNGA